jgi:hypothetical protein
MTADGELVYNDEVTANQWALNSAVECHLHTVEVTGSNPVAPTNIISLLHSHLRVAVVSCDQNPSPMSTR